jgi:hypothetical protein
MNLFRICDWLVGFLLPIVLVAHFLFQLHYGFVGILVIKPLLVRQLFPALMSFY